MPCHDNVPCHTSHTMQHFLMKNQIPPFLQPLYSPDLAPCDLWLFPRTQDGAQKSSYVCWEIQQNATTGLTVLLNKGLKRDVSRNGSRLVCGEVQSFECDQVRLYIYIYTLGTFLPTHTSYFNAGSFRYLLYEDARTSSYQTDKNIQTCDAGTKVSLSS